MLVALIHFLRFRTISASENKLFSHKLINTVIQLLYTVYGSVSKFFYQSSVLHFESLVSRGMLTVLIPDT